jgi:hypothetical protein
LSLNILSLNSQAPEKAQASTRVGYNSSNSDKAIVATRSHFAIAVTPKKVNLCVFFLYFLKASKIPCHFSVLLKESGKLKMYLQSVW